MSRTKRRPTTQVPPAMLAKREGVFGIYRDLGPTRSYDRLIQVIKPKHGDVSKRTLVNWSRQHNWQPRVAEHDQSLAAASQTELDELAPNFDTPEALLRFANLALQRVLKSVPVIRTPQDAKALVDAAEKAIKLAEGLRGGVSDRREAEGSKKRITVLLDAFEAKVQAMHEERCKLAEAQQALLEGKVIDLPPIAAVLAPALSSTAQPPDRRS